MRKKWWVIGMTGLGLAMAALIVHGQDAGKAASPSALPTAPSLSGANPEQAFAPAKPLFIVHLTTGAGWDKGKPAHEQVGFKAHSQNLSRLRSEGLLVMGARYQDREGDKGILIVRAANVGAVDAQFAADPMVKDKLFVLDIAEFQTFYDGFIAQSVAPSGTAGAPASPLDALSWLAGCWVGRSGKNEFRDHWMRPASGLMMGMGRTTSNGKLQSFESMRIELDASDVPVFVAKPSNQPEASFKRVQSDATSIVFENLAHDFPQQVRYQLKADGTLDVRIEGKLKGRDARIEFPMRRASCD